MIRIWVDADACPGAVPDILEDGALEFDMDQFHERMGSASIREKMERVTLALDPNQLREPRVESARVTVMLRDGREHQSFIKQSLGFPARPMERDDVQAKAEGLLEPKFGARRRVLRQLLTTA